MDRNTYTGLFLIMVIIAGYLWFSKPKEQAKQEMQIEHQDSIKKGLIKDAAKASATAKPDTSKKTVDSALLKTPFGAATIGTEKMVTLENSNLRIKLDNKGGRIYSVELKNYKTFDKKPLILFQGEQNRFGMLFSAGGKSINTNDLYFTPSVDNLTVTGADSSTISMKLAYSPTQYIEYVYSLRGDAYKVGLTIRSVGLDNVVSNSSRVYLDWQASLLKEEKDMKQERQYSTVYYYNTDKDVDYLNSGKDDAKTVTDKKVQWISFKQHFFSSVMIAPGAIDKTNITTTLNDEADTVNIKQMEARLEFNRDAQGAVPLQFYFGPNKFDVLKKQGYELDKQIDLGWGPLKYINRWATLPVFRFFNQFNWNYGLIILALTVILKLVLSPLTYRSYLSMAKMRVLKPEMDEIKNKVGEDNPTLLQQEYMKLYKKAGVNPLGGCLPLVLQMPIVFAFFRFFPGLFELRGQSFLWMHDLSTYDSVISFAPVGFLGGINHISLMCLLMTISTLIYTYFNNQISGATGQMKYIGYITPVIFLITLNNYPAGLNYYYFLANMFTFGQQYLIRLMVDDKKIHAQIQENKKKPEDPKKKNTGFQARMEQMMRQQAQVQQQKKK